MVRAKYFAALLILGAPMVCAAGPQAAAVKVPASKAEIVAVMERMAEAQLAAPAYKDKAPVDWVAGAFYVGLTHLTHVSEDTKYLAAEKTIAEKNNWEFKVASGTRGIAMADNETVGQMYIDLAVTTKDLGKLEGIKKQWGTIVGGFDVPANVWAWNGDLVRDGTAMPWWWCDALFMAPPGLTRLSVVTGDKTFIDAMDKQWWITTEKLYDKEEHLFFRDNKYPTQRSGNGKKIFWSRGNGWVIAGTANVLTYMPKDYPTRGKYEQLFKEMAEKLASIQQADGLWRGSLIDPAGSPQPETSGTGFFCYSLAWGINNGLLDRAKYGPVVEKAWGALNERIRPDGLMGWVQAIGEQPTSANAQATQAYAVGAFLLAGCEVIKLHEGK